MRTHTRTDTQKIISLALQTSSEPDILGTDNQTPTCHNVCDADTHIHTHTQARTHTDTHIYTSVCVYTHTPAGPWPFGGQQSPRGGRRAMLGADRQREGKKGRERAPDGEKEFAAAGCFYPTLRQSQDHFSSILIVYTFVLPLSHS